jgi:hypothetical protein
MPLGVLMTSFPNIEVNTTKNIKGNANVKKAAAGFLQNDRLSYTS